MADNKNKPNEGALFENDKQGNPKWPDFKGRFTDSNDNEFWLSAWKHKTEGGLKYLSIAATPITEKKKESKGDKSQKTSDDGWG